MSQQDAYFYLPFFLFFLNLWTFKYSNFKLEPSQASLFLMTQDVASDEKSKRHTLCTHCCSKFTPQKVLWGKIVTGEQRYSKVSHRSTVVILKEDNTENNFCTATFALVFQGDLNSSLVHLSMFDCVNLCSAEVASVARINLLYFHVHDRLGTRRKEKDAGCIFHIVWYCTDQDFLLLWTVPVPVQPGATHCPSVK